MKQSIGTLRFVLALVFLVTLLAAYIFLSAPQFVLNFYEDVTQIDTAHVHLSMVTGAFLLVFAIGTLLAFLKPTKHAGTITLIILMHFAMFIIDVLIMARGTDLQLRYILPEIIYMLAVCTLLIR